MLLGTDTGRRGVSRAAAPAPVPVRALRLETTDEVDTATCACGHPQEAHEHYRPGSDCALCDCPRFRRRR